jgi:hemolysin D
MRYVACAFALRAVEFPVINIEMISERPFPLLRATEQKAASVAQEVFKAERRTRLQHLTATVDGVVQQLAVHTGGGVVTPAQALVIVVPSESQLEIEAIGFVHPGQTAEIEIDSFNFTRYRLLHGVVTLEQSSTRACGTD